MEFFDISGIGSSEIHIEFLSLVSYLRVALGTEVVFSSDISMLRTDRKSRSHCDIWKPIVLEGCLDESLARLNIRDTLAHIEVEYRSSGILALYCILIFERFECIISKIYWKLRGVGIVWILLGSGLDNIWMLFLVFSGKTIGCSLCWSCFEVIHISCLFLVLFEYLSHIIQCLDSKLSSPLR